MERMAPTPAATTMYCDSNGPRHQHSQTSNVNETHRQLGLAEEKRREAALTVQTFRNEHHHNVTADAGILIS